MNVLRGQNRLVLGGSLHWIFHLLGCLIGSALLGWEFGVGAGLTAEIKDMQSGGRWDWLDIAADAIGTLVGEIVHFAIFKRW